MRPGHDRGRQKAEKGALQDAAQDRPSTARVLRSETFQALLAAKRVPSVPVASHSSPRHLDMAHAGEASWSGRASQMRVVPNRP